LGISIKSLKEGCCKSILDNYKIIITDKNRGNKNIKFVDYILDLDSFYLFIEEKSFILAILPPIKGEIQNKTIEDFKNLTSIQKELKVCKSSFRLISDSNRKLKDTLSYIYKNYKNLEKIEKSSFIYLYCKSSLKDVEKILITYFNMKNRKNIFVSCDRIDDFIKKLKEKNEQK